MTITSHEPLITRIRSELGVLLRLAGPVVLANLLNFSMNVVDMIFVGSLGRRELAATALAITWSLGTSIFGYGMASACDAIMGQAVGSKDHLVLGKCLHIGMIVLTVTCIPIGALWCATEPLLLALHQPPELAALTAEYVLYLLPALPAILYYQVLSRYMAAQGIMKPAMYCAAIANVFNIIANYVFIYSLGLGYAGAPIATALGRWLSFLLLCLWTRMSGLYRTTWVNFSFRLLVEERALLLQFIKLGTAGGVALLFELWAFELTTLLASYLGELYLAAHVILLNVCTFSFMMPLGISVAASVRSANLLGEGNGLQARFSTIIAIACGASLMTLNGCIIYALRNVIAHAYTDDSDTIALVAQTAPYGAAFQIFDGTFTVSSGVLRGIGRHRAGAVMSGIGFYVLGVPLAYVFAFHTSIGFQGLWLGVCTGLFTMSCLVVGFLFCWVKWKKEAMLAIERMRKIKQEEGNACAGPDTASSVDKEMDEVTLLDHEVDASGGDDEVPADQDVQL